MHVDAKKTAVSGLLMALAVLLIILSGIFDFNTLFFLALAAFLVGIIIREYGLGWGTGFLIGSAILGFLLAPQKLYCITYVMMAVYVLGTEFLWRFLGGHPDWKNRKQIFMTGKFVMFNVMYLPVLLLFPKLFFAGEISERMLLVFAVGGQAALYIYDRAYEYFLIHVWGRLRDKLFK